MAVPSSSEFIVGFAGLKSAGIVAALAAAAMGVRVVAFDEEIARIAALQRGELPAGLDIVAADAGPRIEYTSTAADLSRCAVVCVFVDAPADANGQRDLSPLKSFFLDVAAAVRADAVLVLVGPIPPGCTRSHAPKGRAVFYQPQSPLAEQVLQPDRLIVGCADPSAPLPAPLAAYLAAFDCPILRMRYESAELSQVAMDLVLASSIGMGSVLAELCRKTGADWAEIVPALDTEPFFAPHLGISETLERDLASARKIAERHDVSGDAIEACVAASRRRRDWVLQRLEEHVLRKVPDARLAVLDAGLAKGSPGDGLLTALAKLKLRVYGGGLALPDMAEVATTPLDACSQVDALVILGADTAVASLDPAAIAAAMRGKTVIDPYRVLDPAAAKQAGLTHYVLGRAA